MAFFLHNIFFSFGERKAMDTPTTSSKSGVVKAIRARELRGVASNISEIFDERNDSLSDSSKLIKELRNREVSGKKHRVDIHGNILERNREMSLYQKDLKVGESY